MEKEIYIDGKIYKAFGEKYYISEYGDVYSNITHKHLKHNLNNHTKHHQVTLYGKRLMVHRLVYHLFIEPINKNIQINHRDDNKDNNHVSNLYAGTQKENMQDCIRNGHRFGNIKCIVIYDKHLNIVLTFPSITTFIKQCKNVTYPYSINSIKSTKWFKDRYEIIDIKRVTTNESYKTLKKEYEDKVAFLEAIRS